MRLPGSLLKPVTSVTGKHLLAPAVLGLSDTQTSASAVQG